MKRYIIGLITGILLTASTFMFIGATTNQDHTHDATEIKYSSYTYGGYGSLQKKIKSLDSHDHDDDYAEEYHNH